MFGLGVTKVTRPQFSEDAGAAISTLFPSSMVRSQSSAAGVLALLQEPDHIFKQHALKALIPLVAQFWAEISEHIAAMCAIHTFPFAVLLFILVILVKSSMRVTNYRNLHAMPQPWSPAKYIISWANTMKRSRLLLDLETRFKPRHVLLALRNM